MNTITINNGTKLSNATLLALGKVFETDTFKLVYSMNEDETECTQRAGTGDELRLEQMFVAEHPELQEFVNYCHTQRKAGILNERTYASILDACFMSSLMSLI